VSLARFADHVIWGRRFERAIAAASAPDIIFCAYPTIEAALTCARYGQKRRVPVVIDLRDMWPDLFAELAPRSLRPLARALLMPAAWRMVRVVTAGDGDDLELYRARARDCPNVAFSGWVRVPQIRELLVRAHLGLVPYRNTPDYVMSVPTKAAEYFASGVPVATCLRGTLPRLLRERQCGRQFDAADPDSLVALVRELRDDPAQCA